MKTFKDKVGTEWEVNLHAGIIIQICAKLGLTLGQLQGLSKDGLGGFDKLEIATVLQLLPILCQKQMRELKIEKDTFLERLGVKEIMTSVIPALSEAVEESFPKPEDTNESPEEGEGDDPSALTSSETSSS